MHHPPARRANGYTANHNGPPLADFAKGAEREFLLFCPEGVHKLQASSVRPALYRLATCRRTTSAYPCVYLSERDGGRSTRRKSSLVTRCWCPAGVTPSGGVRAAQLCRVSVSWDLIVMTGVEPEGSAKPAAVGSYTWVSSSPSICPTAALGFGSHLYLNGMGATFGR